MNLNKQSAPYLASWLITLTLLFIAWQGLFFAIHYHVSTLIDAMVNSSLTNAMFSVVIWKPLLQFVCVQIAAWTVFVCWVWYMAVGCGEWMDLSGAGTVRIGIAIWCLACMLVFGLNAYFYPNSFFAQLIMQFPMVALTATTVTIGLAVVLCLATMLSFLHSLRTARHLLMMLFLMLLVGAQGWVYWHDRMIGRDGAATATSTMPNVIIIGLDSLRPDFTSFGGNEVVTTPHIDEFMRYAVTFTNAYTPLARTYPSWISILTAKYPVHNAARNNLVNPEKVLLNETLAQRMQQAGYETIYATDEKRYSNITKAYGFDQVLGAQMGVNDFLLGGLSDFPLTNLLVNLPAGRYLFPYNYGNRAAAITYDPDAFLKQIKLGLAKRQDKPLFLAVHLCLTHWPFSWSDDQGKQSDHLYNHYQRSVVAVDDQLGKLLSLLEDKHLLRNSVVVLLSDHGTTLGLPGDRMISKDNFRGDEKDLKSITVSRLTTAPEDSMDFQHDYSINTSYGQGNDLLSLKQNHTILAIRHYGNASKPRQIDAVVSLMDVAPTILAELKLSAMDQIDGMSLSEYLNTNYTPQIARTLFMETGDSITEIETDHIYIEKVLKKEIGIYHLNASNGLLYMDPIAAKSIEQNKQRGILQGDWLLVRYPAKTRTRLSQSNNTENLNFENYEAPPYYVLANLKTGEWTIGENNAFAAASPFAELKQSLEEFYKGEMD